MQYKVESSRKVNSSLLDLGRNLRANTNQVSVNTKLNTNLKQKITLKVYIDELTNEMFVDSNAAFKMGLIDTRRVMLGDASFHKVSNNEIDYFRYKNPDLTIDIVEERIKREKEKIKVYQDVNDDLYIDMGASYHINFIRDDEFNNATSKYYGPLQDFEIEFIKNKYNIEKENVDLSNKNDLEETKRM